MLHPKAVVLHSSSSITFAAPFTTDILRGQCGQRAERPTLGNTSGLRISPPYPPSSCTHLFLGRGKYQTPNEGFLAIQVYTCRALSILCITSDPVLRHSAVTLEQF